VGEKYIWPDANQQGISWEPKEHIIKMLTEPKLVDYREHYEFDMAEMIAIKDEQLKQSKYVYFK